MLDQARSTTALGPKNGAEEARERRLESTFFMLNVIFLLILFFIVAANFDVQLQIFPPKSSASAPLPTEAMQLVVNQEGTMFLNGETVGHAQLKKILDKTGKGRALKIAADANLDAIKIAQLIQEVAASGVTRLALVTVTKENGASAE